jgi:hypothetical protein
MLNIPTVENRAFLDLGPSSPYGRRRTFCFKAPKKVIFIASLNTLYEAIFGIINRDIFA